MQKGALPAVFGRYHRNLFDLTTTYQLTPKCYLGLNAAYGRYDFQLEKAGEETTLREKFQSTTPGWGGVALYSNYAFTDVVGLGVHYEYFDDQHQVRYLLAVNNSLTITALISRAASKLQVKPELRVDVSSDDYYEDSNGFGTRQQTTLGVAFIYEY